MNDRKQPPRGIFTSLRGLLLTALSLAQTRLELLAAEIEEEGQRLLSLMLWGALAVFFLGAGALFLAIFVTVLLWDNNRLLALGIITALFLAGGAVATVIAVRLANRRSRLLRDNLGELTWDRAALQREAE